MSARSSITAKQSVAASTLAGGSTVRRAAEAAGVSERTVYDWKHAEAFRSEVDRLRGAMIDEAIGLLSRAASGSVATLIGALKSDDERVALRAAMAILDSLIRVREHAALASRLEEMEARLAEVAPQLEATRDL